MTWLLILWSVGDRPENEYISNVGSNLFTQCCMAICLFILFFLIKCRVWYFTHFFSPDKMIFSILEGPLWFLITPSHRLHMKHSKMVFFMIFCHNGVFNLEHFRPVAWWNVTTVSGNRVDLDFQWCIMGRKSFQIHCFCFAIWAATHIVHMVFDSFTFTMTKINFYNCPWTLHQNNILNPQLPKSAFICLTKMHQRIWLEPHKHMM